MSASPLPIGVLLPTRNCAGLLKGHLGAIVPWLGRVQEVVAVDSQSTDGTRELLASIRHPNLRVLQHPPGLYQSWNFGVSQLQSDSCYISTVGETITGEGLEHLHGAMQRLRCDVVISKPRFVDLQGRPMEEPEWPVDDLIRTLRIREPLALGGPALFAFTLVHYRNAILGSSASNLYRTRFLRDHPFPADYGTVGDGAWGLLNWPEARAGVTPERFSTFREHPKAYSPAEYAVDELGRKLLALVERTCRERQRSDPSFARIAEAIDTGRAFALLRRQLEAHERLERCRRGRWPWSLNPAAWRARHERSTAEREIKTWKETALERIHSQAAPDPAVRPGTETAEPRRP